MPQSVTRLYQLMPVGVAAYPQKSLSEDDQNKHQHQPMRTVHQTYKPFTGALSAEKKKQSQRQRIRRSPYFQKPNHTQLIFAAEIPRETRPSWMYAWRDTVSKSLLLRPDNELASDQPQQ